MLLVPQYFDFSIGTSRHGVLILSCSRGGFFGWKVGVVRVSFRTAVKSQVVILSLEWGIRLASTLYGMVSALGRADNLFFLDCVHPFTEMNIDGWSYIYPFPNDSTSCKNATCSLRDKLQSLSTLLNTLFTLKQFFLPVEQCRFLKNWRWGITEKN